MKLFEVCDDELEGDIDDVIARLKEIKKEAKAKLKAQGKKQSDYYIAIETRFEYGYYDAIDIVHEIEAWKRHEK